MCPVYTEQPQCKIQEEGTSYNIKKIINNEVLKDTIDMCSAVDSLKKSVLLEDGPVWFKKVAKT